MRSFPSRSSTVRTARQFLSRAVPRALISGKTLHADHLASHLQPELWQGRIPFADVSVESLLERFAKIGQPTHLPAKLKLRVIPRKYENLCFSILSALPALSEAFVAWRLTSRDKPQEFWKNYLRFSEILQYLHVGFSTVFEIAFWQKETRWNLAHHAAELDALDAEPIVSNPRLTVFEKDLLRTHLRLSALLFNFLAEELTLVDKTFLFLAGGDLKKSHDLFDPKLKHVLREILSAKAFPIISASQLPPEVARTFPALVKCFDPHLLQSTATFCFPDNPRDALNLLSDLLHFPANQAWLAHYLHEASHQCRHIGNHIFMFGRVLEVQPLMKALKTFGKALDIVLLAGESERHSFSVIGDIEQIDDPSGIQFLAPRRVRESSERSRFSEFFFQVESAVSRTFPITLLADPKTLHQLRGCILDPFRFQYRRLHEPPLFAISEPTALSTPEISDIFVKQHQAYWRTWRTTADKVTLSIPTKDAFVLYYVSLFSPYQQKDMLDRIGQRARSKSKIERTRALEEILLFLNDNPYALPHAFSLMIKNGELIVDANRLEKLIEIFNRFFEEIARRTPEKEKIESIPPPPEGRVFALGIVPTSLRPRLEIALSLMQDYLDILFPIARDILLEDNDLRDFILMNLNRLLPEKFRADFVTNFDKLVGATSVPPLTEWVQRLKNADLEIMALKLEVLRQGWMVEQEGHLQPTPRGREIAKRETALSFAQKILAQVDITDFAKWENVALLWDVSTKAEEATSDVIEHRILPAHELPEKNWSHVIAVLKPENDSIYVSRYLSLKLKTPADPDERYILACDQNVCFVVPLSLLRTTKACLVEKDCLGEPFSVGILRGEERPAKRTSGKFSHLAFPQATGGLILGVESVTGTLLVKNLDQICQVIEDFDGKNNNSFSHIYEIVLRDTPSGERRVIREGFSVYLENCSQALRNELKAGSDLETELATRILAALPAKRRGKGSSNAPQQVAGKAEFLRAADFLLSRRNGQPEFLLALVEHLDWRNDYNLERARSALGEEGRLQSLVRTITTTLLQETSGILEDNRRASETYAGISGSEKRALQDLSLKKPDILRIVDRALRGADGIAYTSLESRISLSPQSLFDARNIPRKIIAAIKGTPSQIKGMGKIFMVAGADSQNMPTADKILEISCHGVSRFFDLRDGRMLLYERVTNFVSVQNVGESFRVDIAPYVPVRNLSPKETDERIEKSRQVLNPHSGGIGKLLRTDFKIGQKDQSPLKEVLFEAWVAYCYPHWLPEIGPHFTASFHKRWNAERVQAGFLEFIQLLENLHGRKASQEEMTHFLSYVVLPYLKSEMVRQWRGSRTHFESLHETLLKEFGDFYTDMFETLVDHVTDGKVRIDQHFLNRHHWLKEDNLPQIFNFYGRFHNILDLPAGELPQVERKVTQTPTILVGVLRHEKEEEGEREKRQDVTELFRTAAKIVEPWGSELSRKLLTWFLARMERAENLSDLVLRQSYESMYRGIARQLDILQRPAKKIEGISRFKPILRHRDQKTFGEEHFLHQSMGQAKGQGIYVETILRPQTYYGEHGDRRPAALRVNVFYVPNEVDFWRRRRTRNDDLSFRFEEDDFKGFHFNITGTIRNELQAIMRINIPPHKLPEVDRSTFRQGCEQFRQQVLDPIKAFFLW